MLDSFNKYKDTGLKQTLGFKEVLKNRGYLIKQLTAFLEEFSPNCHRIIEILLKGQSSEIWHTVIIKQVVWLITGKLQSQSEDSH